MHPASSLNHLTISDTFATVLAVFKAAALSSTLSECLSLGRHYPDVPPHIPHTHKFLSGLFLLQAPLLWKGTLSSLPSCGH